MLTQVTTCDNFPQSRILVDALAGVNMLTEAFVIAELTLRLKAGEMAVALTGGMICFDVDTFTTVPMMVVFITTTIFENFVLVLHALHVRCDVVIDVLTGTVIDFAPSISFDVIADVDANICIARKTVFEFIIMLTSSEEAFLFRLGA